MEKKNAVGVTVYNQGHCEPLWHKYTLFCMTLFYPIAMSQRKHVFKPLMCIFIPFLIYMLKSVKLKTCYILKLTNCCYFVIYFWVSVVSNITSTSKDSQVHGPFHAAGLIYLSVKVLSSFSLSCDTSDQLEDDPSPRPDLALLFFDQTAGFVHIIRCRRPCSSLLSPGCIPASQVWVCLWRWGPGEGTGCAHWWYLQGCETAVGMSQQQCSARLAVTVQNSCPRRLKGRLAIRPGSF